MIVGIHVDDLFGCYNPEDEQTQKLVTEIKKIFSFREWHVGSESKSLTYCGAQIEHKDTNHWRIHHEEYFKKQKPITIPKTRQSEQLPVTNNEQTALKGLGGLQWPATQTAPHLQAQVSLLAGQVTTTTTKTLEAANKVLRYAKSNAHVGPDYRFLGQKTDVTFVAFSDASFACRNDLSSQGGFPFGQQGSGWRRRRILQCD